MAQIILERNGGDTTYTDNTGFFVAGNTGAGATDATHGYVFINFTEAQVRFTITASSGITFNGEQWSGKSSELSINEDNGMDFVMEPSDFIRFEMTHIPNAAAANLTVQSTPDLGHTLVPIGGDKPNFIAAHRYA